VAGERAYLASQQAFFAIVDLHDPAAPALLGSLSIPISDFMYGPQFVGMAVRGDHVYLVYNYSISQHANGGAFLTIDVRDPVAPALQNRSDNGFIVSFTLAARGPMGRRSRGSIKAPRLGCTTIFKPIFDARSSF